MLTVELREWKWTIVRGGLERRSSKRGGLVAVSFILAITQRLRASCIRAMARLLDRRKNKFYRYQWREIYQTRSSVASVLWFFRFLTLKAYFEKIKWCFFLYYVSILRRREIHEWIYHGQRGNAIVTRKSRYVFKRFLVITCNAKEKVFYIARCKLNETRAI